MSTSLPAEVGYENLCEAFAEDKNQHYCGDLVLGWGVAKRLFSAISEQDFNQNVGEVAYSIYPGCGVGVFWVESDS